MQMATALFNSGLVSSTEAKKATDMLTISRRVERLTRQVENALNSGDFRRYFTLKAKLPQELRWRY